MNERAPDSLPTPHHLADKERAELSYWFQLSRHLTENCSTMEERRQALLQVCWEKTFPRYKESLDLEDGSLVGLRVLDLGCGPHGGLIGFEDCEAWGADHLLSEYRCMGYPLEMHGIRYTQSKSEDLPFRAGYFDLVTCVNALDHVDDLAGTFREVSRVLGPRGRFLAQINFHAASTPTEPHCFTHHELLSTAHRHHLGVRRIQYQEWIEEAGEHRYLYDLQKHFPQPS